MMMAGGKVVVPAETPVQVIEEEKADWGEIFGQSRTFYVDRTYTGLVNNNRNSLATGGYIGYKTPVYNGFSAAVAAYGTLGLDIHTMSPEEDFGATGKWNSYDPSLFGFEGEDYIYKFSAHNIGKINDWFKELAK